MHFSMCSSSLGDTELEPLGNVSLENPMKRKPSNTPIPPHDYRRALLGAEPMPRLNEGRSAYFAESPRWHPAVIAGALAMLKG